MSASLNLDSMRSHPALQTAPTVHQLAREIDGLRAKVAALELELQRMEGRKVSRRVVEDMIGRASSRVLTSARRSVKAVVAKRLEAIASGVSAELKAKQEPGSIKALEAWVESEMQKERQRGRDRRRLINALAFRVEALEAKHDATPKP